ncbi:MAG: adenylosuccinate synthetase [Candidatus Margulisiibacteriota bacterium]|jgi:adenylosuccinate synthase
MAVKIVIGTQWGDEGKGKITDILSEKADIVVRYQGGNNAGHTVVISGKVYKLHLIPSGIFYPGVVCVVGNGVVLDPQEFIKEVDLLKKNGIKVSPDNLKVSKTCHIIQAEHKERDIQAESKRGEAKIGTTMRGIGPAYEDKISRHGLRAEQYGKELEPYLIDSVVYLNDAVKQGKKMVLEGAQGTMLDVDHGTYPYVTSSNPTAGGACTGSGLGPTCIDDVLGVVKAYSTRVGEGPFPTELKDKLGEEIRTIGHEFGTTTGRPRRCGWLDLVVLRHAVRINGLTELVITKIDVLDTLPLLKVCTGYKYKGKILKDYPSDLEVFKECEPVLVEFAGWQSDLTKLTDKKMLPPNALKYLEFIAQETGVPISIVSVGADREQTIFMK